MAEQRVDAWQCPAGCCPAGSPAALHHAADADTEHGTAAERFGANHLPTFETDSVILPDFAVPGMKEERTR
jgi:hypothetical protein